MTAHVLYRFYSGTGQLLYVGITMNPPARFKQHRATKDWWREVSGITIEQYGSREELAAVERRAIQVEHPLHNIVHSKPATEPIAEPDEPPTTAIDDDLAALLQDSPSTPLGLFAGLFGRQGEQEAEQRAIEANRAKRAARDACRFCDHLGYRGMVVCDHVDRWSTNPRREAQKRQFEVIEGGGV